MITIFNGQIPVARALPLQPYRGPRANVFSVRSVSGPAVTSDTALRCGAVMACVRLYANAIASMPAHVMRDRVDGGKEKATREPAYRLLHSEPNPIMTSFEWREAVVGDVLLRGNHYSEIESGPDGRLRALWPLNPDLITVEPRGSTVAYFMRLNSDRVQIPSDRLLHIKGFTRDGITGVSPISYFADSVGIGLGVSEYTGRFFANGANTNLVVEYPETLSEEAEKNLRAWFDARQGGLKNVARPLVLEEGVKAHALGVSPRDSQLLELWNFSVIDIARIFNLPPSAIGADTKTASYASLEQDNIQLVIRAIMPLVVRIEQAVNRALFGGDSGLYLKIMLQGLMRGDQKSRYEAYTLARNGGWLNVDEIRELEDANPLPAGKGQVYLQPLNMAEAGSMPPAGGAPARSMRSRATAEPQALRSDTARRKATIRAFRAVWRETADRIVRRETREVRAIIKRQRERADTKGLAGELEKFYANDHKPAVALNIRAVVESMADAVLADMGVELTGTEYRDFVEAFIAGYAVRWTASSLGQLKQQIEIAAAALADPGEAVERRLTEWEEKRADKEAGNETTRLGNAAARVLFGLSGVTRLVWRSSGENCPICREMEGRTVGIEEPFTSDGEQLSDLVVRGDVNHPPLHRGCDCIIEAV